MSGLGSVLVLGTFGMAAVIGVIPFRMSTMASMRLTQFLRFLEVVTFAGDKGRGCKNHEHVKGFHCAP